MMGIQERKEREKEHRREEILNAAEKTFFDKGLQNATMDEIADAAELSKGTLYLYYSSKEDLYLAVMMRGFDVLQEMFTEAISKARSVVEAIWELGRTYFRFAEEHPHYFRMFHFFQNPSLHKQVSEEMMTSCNGRTQELWKLVIDVFRKGITEGALRKELNPAECAVILWSSSDAILTRIDFEYDQWKQRLSIDLKHAFYTSNALLLQAMLMPSAEEEFSAVIQSSTISQLSE